ncbi:MAG: DEAD/DEAH box helicase [Desulfobacterales bacterium]|nr:DEAD/DEAH box helicase [Desulfobacterales bacterium]
MQKRYFSPRRHGKHQRPKILKIRPGADPSLKNVFSRIGIPSQKSFIPDPFQIEALDAIQKSDCLVTVPTGSGKTWIARQAIEQMYKSGKRSWYASPLKALSNSIFAEFSQYFGEKNMGILTGDRKENPDAPIIIGTTEILRNQLYDAMHRGEDLSTDLVILDEAHYLGDEDRGVVWEETIIYLPVRIPILMLSATIGNAGQISKWLSSIRNKPCKVITAGDRPVPLYPLFFHPSGTLIPLTMEGFKKGKARLHKKVKEYVNSEAPPLIAPPRKLPPFGKILQVLRTYNLLPALFFLKSRSDCDAALEKCRDFFQHDHGRTDERRGCIVPLIEQNPHLSKHRQLSDLEHLAIGSHHSGQLPAWKLVLESLMTKGLLDAIFATSTVAAGVNFPARTVVFLNSDRFNGKDFLPLSSTEFHQMTGRAGRRGMDKIGFAIAVPGKFMDLELCAKLVNAPPSDVNSQIMINFSMVLNLLLSHSPEQIEKLLKRSFATFQLMRKKSKLPISVLEAQSRVLWEEFSRHMDFLKQINFVDKNNALSEDGKWASRLRVDHPLVIAEGFRKKLFPEKNPAHMAGIIASFVNERESDVDPDTDIYSKRLHSAFLKVKQGLSPFKRHMAARGFDTQPLYFKPAVTIFDWANGMPWEKAIAKSEMAEGDLAMLILRTADNLQHIRALSSVFKDAAETAHQAIMLIKRHPVVMDYELEQEDDTEETVTP